MLEEIRFEIQKLQTDKEALTKFGKTMAVILGILTLIAWYRESGAFPYTFLLALIFLFLGILWPMSLKRFYTIWMTIAITMGFVMTKVILSLMFYTAFTIIGFISRLFNRDRLGQQYEDEADTYWQPYEKPNDFKRHLERQF